MQEILWLAEELSFWRRELAAQSYIKLLCQFSGIVWSVSTANWDAVLLFDITVMRVLCRRCVYVHVHMQLCVCVCVCVCGLCSHEWYFFISSQSNYTIAFNLTCKREKMKCCIWFMSGEKLFIYFAVFCNVKNLTQNMQISVLDMW